MLFTPERMGRYRPHYKHTIAVIRRILERAPRRTALLSLIQREEKARDNKS